MSTTREPGQELFGGTIDPRFGVVIPMSKKEIVATGDETSASIALVNTTVSGIEVEPKTRFIAERTKRNITLPADQVWYGRRREQFPPVLLSVVIRGSETKEAAINYVTAPEGLLWARYRRRWSFGPPGDGAIGLASLFGAQPYLDFAEFDETTHHVNSGTSSRSGTETSDGSYASTQDSTDSSTSARQHTSHVSGTHSGTHTTADSGSHTSQEHATHSATDQYTQASQHITSNQGTNTDNSSYTHNSTTEEAGHIDGAVLVGDPVVNRLSGGTGSNTTTHQTTSSATSLSTEVGSGTRSSISDSTGSGSSTNNNTGSNSGTTINDETGTNTTATQSTGSNANTGTRNGTTNSTSTGTESGTGLLTRKALLRVELRSCLRATTTVVVGSTTLTIPATTPSDLPWGHWIEVARDPEHWLDGVWVTETVEVFLPPKSYGI